MVYAKYLTIHSDLFGDIPANMFFPLSKHLGWNLVDFSDSYLMKMVELNKKKFDITFDNFFSEFDVNKVKELMENTLNGVNKDEKQFNSVRLHSFFVNPNYYLKDNSKFEKNELNSKFKVISSLLNKMDCGQNQVLHQSYLAE